MYRISILSQPNYARTTVSFYNAESKQASVAHQSMDDAVGRWMVDSQHHSLALDSTLQTLCNNAAKTKQQMYTDNVYKITQNERQSRAKKNLLHVTVYSNWWKKF